MSFKGHISSSSSVTVATTAVTTLESHTAAFLIMSTRNELNAAVNEKKSLADRVIVRNKAIVKLQVETFSRHPNSDYRFEMSDLLLDVFRSGSI
jgi:hypothetical protein